MIAYLAIVYGTIFGLCTALSRTLNILAAIGLAIFIVPGLYSLLTTAAPTHGGRIRGDRVLGLLTALLGTIGALISLFGQIQATHRTSTTGVGATPYLPCQEPPRLEAPLDQTTDSAN